MLYPTLVRLTSNAEDTWQDSLNKFANIFIATLKSLKTTIARGLKTT